MTSSGEILLQQAHWQTQTNLKRIDNSEIRKNERSSSDSICSNSSSSSSSSTTVLKKNLASAKIVKIKFNANLDLLVFSPFYNI